MQLYVSRREPLRTPTPPSQCLLAGCFMSDGNSIEIRLVPTRLNHAKEADPGKNGLSKQTAD